MAVHTRNPVNGYSPQVCITYVSVSAGMMLTGGRGKAYVEIRLFHPMCFSSLDTDVSSSGF